MIKRMGESGRRNTQKTISQHSVGCAVRQLQLLRRAIDFAARAPQYY
jgi:hypothetical protein